MFLTTGIQVPNRWPKLTKGDYDEALSTSNQVALVNADVHGGIDPDIVDASIPANFSPPLIRQLQSDVYRPIKMVFALAVWLTRNGVRSRSSTEPTPLARASVWRERLGQRNPVRIIWTESDFHNGN